MQLLPKWNRNLVVGLSRCPINRTMHQPRLSACLVGAITALLLSGHALADSETFQLASPAISGLNGSFAFTGFNPSLGTLTGITLDLTSTASANVSIINIGSVAGSFTNAFSSFQYSLSGPDATALFTAVPVDATVASDTVSPGTTNYPAGTPVVTNTDILISSDFSSYETANPDFTYSRVVGTYGGTTADSNILFGGNASVTPSGSITYTYAAVPEPSSWEMGIICVSLFALLRFGLRRNVR
jgi:methyl coenzyme M reductase beta subunit